ncbi:DUF6642 family protein [Bacteroides acidifaciens]|uniref:DUF6642 family protein n=1 Tax=Bacteroides acidifaciens TaxID=85831 RepID=UPI002578EDE5|nr:DUF6642 family protein [Bacteroides acidifaciens]
MMRKAHDIICLEAEWLYNSCQKRNRFNLKTEPLLNWLKEYHDCNVIYRHILSKADLQHYMDYFNPEKRDFKSYGIVYIACHGNEAALSLEGNDGDIDLDTLAEISGNFFSGRTVHFGSCCTLADPEAVKKFKARTGAKLVSGYTKPVDPMKSAIADMAFFNDLMYIDKRFGIITNEERSSFRKTYQSLLNELGFVAF